MKYSAVARLLGLGVCLSCCLALAACGEESHRGDIETGSEKALFIAYAASQSSEDLHTIMFTSLQSPVGTLISILGPYYVEYALDHEYTAPASVDLSDASLGLEIPSGITGTLYTTTTDALYRIEQANSFLELAGYSNNLGSYSGRVRVGGETTNKTSFIINKQTISPTNLTINFTDKNFDKATYSLFSFAYDNSGAYPTYTFNGNLEVDGSSYGFTNLTYTTTGLNTLSIAGTLSYGGDDYAVSGSVTFNSSGIWVDGTLTITVNDEDTVEVALSESGATFTQGEEEWEKDTWWDDRLAP